MTSSKNTESGNILIYILGAIFLLGVLIITMKSSNTPGSNIDEETLMLRASEIQDYGSELERAVAYVLRNGHSEVDIRFAHPDAASAYGDITDEPTRQIFHRDGGGALYRDIPNGIQVTSTPWYFTGRSTVNGVGTNEVAGDGNLQSADLTVMLNNVTKKFCLLVNEKNDIENTSETPPKDTNNIRLDLPFVGSYSENTTIGDQGTGFTFGKTEGCIEGDATPAAGTYHYYRVLLPR